MASGAHSPGISLGIPVAGLVVSFIAGGICAPVGAAHTQFKTALAAGQLQVEHIKALMDALVASGKELKEFAGLLCPDPNARQSSRSPSRRRFAYEVARRYARRGGVSLTPRELDHEE